MPQLMLTPSQRFLEIEDKSWDGLVETATCTPSKNQAGAFMSLLVQENGENSDSSPKTADQELSLSKGVDAMASSMEYTPEDCKQKKDQRREYAKEYQEKYSNAETTSKEVDHTINPDVQIKNQYTVPDEQGKTHSITPNELGESRLLVTDEQGRNQDAPKTDAQQNLYKELNEKPFEEAAILGYPRKITVLYELLSACLANAPVNTKKSTPCRKGYDARHRVALRLLATWFDVKWIKMEALEKIVASSAMAFLKEESEKNEQSTDNQCADWKRGGIVGAAALTGGTLMAITGGLAAPAIAAGVSALAPTLGTIVPVVGASGFAAAASAAGSVAGSAAVAASFGVAGAGLTGAKMARRTGDVEEFHFKPIGENHNQGRLAVEILVAGFVFEEEDFKRPWQGLTDNMESFWSFNFRKPLRMLSTGENVKQVLGISVTSVIVGYALQWESENLIAVSTAIQDWLTSKLALELMKRGAMMTVLSSLLTALAWPAALLTLTDIIDSSWAVALDRSDKAGIILADVLLQGLQGQRPVTLVGFSLGAKVIFKCLEILAENEHGAGIVERVVLLGAPISIRDSNWEAVRKVVGGRFVNVYSSNDWMLGFAFRANLLTQGLAGIQPVEVPGIQNVEMTELIEGHSSYLWTTQQILEQLDLDSSYPVFNSRSTTPVHQ
ncbi:hypothetical protein Leryth_012966 [Lithospermum erythrorhizon]|nr:hypothetical protein Leryth_012966 [Lithospermum erythrorhizon]